MNIPNRGCWLALAVSLALSGTASAQDRIVPGKAPSQVGSTMAVMCADPASGLPGNCSSSFQLSPTVTVQAAAYAAGNSEGGLITLTGSARVNGGSGTLVNIRLRSAGGSTNQIYVYAWSKTPASTCTDKSAFSLSASDSAYALPGFPVSVTLGGSPGSFDTSTYGQLSGLNSVFKNQDTTAGTAIYVCLVAAGSVTPAATTDLSLVADGFQD